VIGISRVIQLLGVLSIALWIALPADANNLQVQTQHLSVELASIHNASVLISVTADGFYSIFSPGSSEPVLRSQVGASIGTHLIQSSNYPDHRVSQSSFQDSFGSGEMLTVTHSGLAHQPDLICTFHLYKDLTWGDLQVTIRNTTGRVVGVKAIRSVYATDGPIISLNGPTATDRILSDSFSEDTPEMKIVDLGEAPGGMYRAVGSQLIYNQKSGQSLFLGALTSNRLLTVFRLKTSRTSDTTRMLSYEVTATGTTEVQKEETLQHSPLADQVELNLPLHPGANLDSEKLMFAIGSDYHEQLETYGRVIRILHNARVDTETPIGWWSWTAYYYGITQGTAITNAEWLTKNLKDMGYSYFHIDEGYQYARGEYSTADSTNFPQGMEFLGDHIRSRGLTFGIWTAPFEVSGRSWIFKNHKDWLVQKEQGKPIRIGFVEEHQVDALYVLDTTNPGAQEYLRQTYRTLVHDWGVRFIKMDFMEQTAIEGHHYRPNTTALEAQRIGLQLIRDTVGEEVVLDKDGSPMLNPVGIVDAGRISVDTGHTFGSSLAAAPGIAARYYMNRNFFVSDPDAFTVSRQTLPDQDWHNGPQPLTLDEAHVSIALSAVSGGMYEIGDDLPTLGVDKDRLALVRNQDLLDMARLGRASRPVDLMSYSPQDQMPSIFSLQEDKHQSILTLFNWTEQTRSHTLQLSDLGFTSSGGRHAYDVLDNLHSLPIGTETLTVKDQAPHSVRVIKIVEDQIPAAAPTVTGKVPASARLGEDVTMFAQVDPEGVPAVGYSCDFGDGTNARGATVHHTYTVSKDQSIRLTTDGIDGIAAVTTFSLQVTGKLSSIYKPEEKRRWLSPKQVTHTD